MEGQGLSCAREGARWYSYFGRQFDDFLQNQMYSHCVYRQLCSYICLPKGVENLCPLENLHVNIYSSIIHNCQKLKEIKAFLCR